MLPTDGTEEQSNPTQGSGPVKPSQEILSPCDPVSRGNTSPTDLISSQPLPAAAPPADASQGAAGIQKPHSDPQLRTCTQCVLTIPDHATPAASLRGPQGSSSSVHSSSRRDRGRVNRSGSKQPDESCFELLLACLWCQGSALLLGLLDACSSCLQAPCSSCCRAFVRCCSAIQEAPVEELNCHAHCHSVLFESCCEPTECLEFCLECCEICHRS